MTDRDLLEFAAKAAGMDVSFIGPLGVYTRATDTQAWNPLTDDGDALRLAVKLGLEVCIDIRYEYEPRTHVIGFCNDVGAGTLDAIEVHGDPYAATRRAIVRAAAEIGRSMT